MTRRDKDGEEERQEGGGQSVPPCSHIPSSPLNSIVSPSYLFIFSFCLPLLVSFSLHILPHSYSILSSFFLFSLIPLLLLLCLHSSFFSSFSFYTFSPSLPPFLGTTIHFLFCIFILPLSAYIFPLAFSLFPTSSAFLPCLFVSFHPLRHLLSTCFLNLSYHRPFTTFPPPFLPPFAW